MPVSLRPFQTDDIKNLQDWAKAINAQSYMSRLHPKRFDGQTIDDKTYFCWFVIVYDDVDVGTVWLEKEKTTDKFIELSILIGNSDLLGIGIGRKAIEQAIFYSKSVFQSSAIRLDVRKNNLRAQACYSACGFREISQGVKTNEQGERIEFLTMEKSIPNQSV